MSAPSAFTVFETYCALKAHFRTDYDFFKFNGKTNAKPSSLQRRNDKYYFSKLAKNKNFKEVLLANFVENESTWIGELVEEEAEEYYRRWKKKLESLTYMYQQDLSKMDSKFNDNFIAKDGNHPKLLTLFLHKQINLETLVILEKIVGFRKKWDLSIKEKYIWPDISKKIKSYSPFIVIDKEKMRKITAEHFS